MCDLPFQSNLKVPIVILAILTLVGLSNVSAFKYFHVCSCLFNKAIFPGVRNYKQEANYLGAYTQVMCRVLMHAQAALIPLILSQSTLVRIPWSIELKLFRQWEWSNPRPPARKADTLFSGPGAPLSCRRPCSNSDGLLFNLSYLSDSASDFISQIIKYCLQLFAS